ncbi:hypothetical protein QBC39DRAFT_412310 [Podospora conica]|nr:hypothetical protein QBC39DRAFT_412310 [Schizothecium conicum]
MRAVAMPVSFMVNLQVYINLPREHGAGLVLVLTWSSTKHLDPESSPALRGRLCSLTSCRQAMRSVKTILRRLLCDSTQDPRDRRQTWPTMSGQVPQQYHHRQAYDEYRDDDSILTSPLRVPVRRGPVPASRPPVAPRVPDRYAQDYLDVESYEQPRRTERQPRAPASTTRRPTASTPTRAPSRSTPLNPTHAPTVLRRRSQRERDVAAKGQLDVLPARVYEQPRPRRQEEVDGRQTDATRGRPDEPPLRREQTTFSRLPVYPPPEEYIPPFEESLPPRRKDDRDEGRFDDPRRGRPRERPLPRRRDILDADRAPPPPPRLYERPIYQPREVVVYDDTPVSPPRRSPPARHEPRHKPLPERLPQAPQPPQPRQRPQAPQPPPPPQRPRAPQPAQPSQRPQAPRPPPTPQPPHPTDLDRTLLKLLNTLHGALSHTHYAITGPLALTAWGYPPPSSPTTTTTPTVSLLCPVDDRSVIRAWAAAAGFGVRTSRNPDEMTVDIPLRRGADDDGPYRPTRRFTVVLHPLPPAEWAAAARESAVLRGSAYGVRVAGLLGLVDWFAGEFGKARGSRERGEAGRAVLWLLERVVRERGGVVRAGEVPRVVEGGCWRGLVEVFGDEAEDLLGWCGLTMGLDAPPPPPPVEGRGEMVATPFEVREAEDGVWAALVAMEGEVHAAAAAGPGRGGWV